MNIPNDIPHADSTGTPALTVASASIDVASPGFATTYEDATPIPQWRPLPSRLLGVWAHPDDEAYMSAGLMARVVDHGGSVTVVTATRGERGTSNADLYSTEAFADHREHELRASLDELGVHDVRLLGLPDGGCHAEDPEGPIAHIVAAIDEVRPDLIVTFGPDGITWHPDHAAVSTWTTEAWRRSHHRADLLYAAFSVDKERRFHDMHARIGLYDDFGDGHAAPASLAQIGLECSLDGAELARKRRALAAHHSQTAELAALLGEDQYLDWVRVESFRRLTAAEITGAADGRAARSGCPPVVTWAAAEAQDSGSACRPASPRKRAPTCAR